MSSLSCSQTQRLIFTYFLTDRLRPMRAAHNSLQLNLHWVRFVVLHAVQQIYEENPQRVVQQVAQLVVRVHNKSKYSGVCAEMSNSLPLI